MPQANKYPILHFRNVLFPGSCQLSFLIFNFFELVIVRAAYARGFFLNLKSEKRKKDTRDYTRNREKIILETGKGGIHLLESGKGKLAQNFI